MRKIGVHTIGEEGGRKVIRFGNYIIGRREEREIEEEGRKRRER